jgi:hypothetical protein
MGASLRFAHASLNTVDDDPEALGEVEPCGD